MTRQQRRRVDAAMIADRPAKDAVRRLWIDEVLRVAPLLKEIESTDTAYLTLSGAAGIDIQLLIEEGFIRLTEQQQIAEEDMYKVVAVESSPQAVVALLRKFPGLKVVEAPYENIIRGEGPFAWPDNAEERKLACALVVNLDLNEPLKGELDRARVKFPVISKIRKFAQLHSEAGITSWVLCLTLHAEVDPDPAVREHLSRFVQDNFSELEAYSEVCAALLGPELQAKVIDERRFAEESLDEHEQQKLLLVLIPKLVAAEVADMGWSLDPTANLLYGGGDVAPMTTWVLRFTRNRETAPARAANYRAALMASVQRAGAVSAEGEIRLFR